MLERTINTYWHALWLAPLALVGALYAAATPQNPAPAPATPAAGSQAAGAAAKSPAQQAEAARRAEITKQMLGAWTLERYEHPTQLVQQDDVRGCALVNEGYMMIEFHARRPSRIPVGNQWVMLYQSGLYQWLFETDTRITCATVLGHGNFDDNDGEYEAPGTPRQFDLDVGKVNMTLTKPDGVRFVFTRLPPRDKLSEDTLKLMEEIRVNRGQR
jgi:hypothetical protein